MAKEVIITADNKINGTIDALSSIVKLLEQISLWRLDSIVQVDKNECVFYVELLNFSREPIEKYVEILRTDLLTAGHLASVLKIEIEYDGRF